MKCSYGWFKRWSQRFQIQLRYSYDDEIIEWILSRCISEKTALDYSGKPAGLMGISQSLQATSRPTA